MRSLTCGFVPYLNSNTSKRNNSYLGQKYNAEHNGKQIAKNYDQLNDSAI